MQGCLGFQHVSRDPSRDLRGGTVKGRAYQAHLQPREFCPQYLHLCNRLTVCALNVTEFAGGVLNSLPGVCELAFKLHDLLLPTLPQTASSFTIGSPPASSKVCEHLSEPVRRGDRTVPAANSLRLNMLANGLADESEPFLTTLHNQARRQAGFKVAARASCVTGKCKEVAWRLLSHISAKTRPVKLPRSPCRVASQRRHGGTSADVCTEHCTC